MRCHINSAPTASCTACAAFGVLATLIASGPALHADAPAGRYTITSDSVIDRHTRLECALQSTVSPL